MIFAILINFAFPYIWYQQFYQQFKIDKSTDKIDKYIDKIDKLIDKIDKYIDKIDKYKDKMINI